MRRALLLAGLAVWLFSCADRGNEQGQENTTDSVQTSDPRDTVSIGIGAGANGQAGGGAGVPTGTGATGTGGTDSGAGKGGNDSTDRGGLKQ